MMWPQKGLLIGLISNYKGQVKMSLQTHIRKEEGHASIHIETARVATPGECVWRMYAGAILAR